jgi:hypothetical protein
MPNRILKAYLAEIGEHFEIHSISLFTEALACVGDFDFRGPAAI